MTALKITGKGPKPGQAGEPKSMGPAKAGKRDAR